MSYINLCSAVPHEVLNTFSLYRLWRVQFILSAGVHPEISLCIDTSSTTISSPPATSVDTTSESTTNQSHSRNRSKNQDARAKRGARTRSPLTTPSSTRRSPRFVVCTPSRCISRWLLLLQY
jgi:hypothetical protein